MTGCKLYTVESMGLCTQDQKVWFSIPMATFESYVEVLFSYFLPSAQDLKVGLIFTTLAKEGYVFW